MRWIRQDDNHDARFTTMFDLYALPDDFPGYEAAKGMRDPYERVGFLERAFRDDVDDWRFVPYIQLHEFEALLLSQPEQLSQHFDNRDREIAQLAEMAERYNSPELIDDGSDSAPSKRIIRKIPEYQGTKPSVGPIVAGRIGLPALRAKCSHFGDWVSELESLCTQV